MQKICCVLLCASAGLAETHRYFSWGSSTKALSLMWAIRLCWRYLRMCIHTQAEGRSANVLRTHKYIPLTFTLSLPPCSLPSPLTSIACTQLTVFPGQGGGRRNGLSGRSSHYSPGDCREGTTSLIQPMSATWTGVIVRMCAWVYACKLPTCTCTYLII